MKREKLYKVIKGLLALSTLFFCVSCENDVDLFKKENSKPSLNVEIKGVYVDNVTDSVKIGTPMQYKFTLSDEYMVTIKRVELEGGSVALKTGNDTVPYNIEVNPCKGIISFGSSSVGTLKGMFTIKDVFDEETVFPFELVAFTNVKPVCKIVKTKIPEHSNFEALIDLSGSIDPDLRFGGGIVLYEYNIGNYYKLSTEIHSSIYHIFPTTGTYVIKCRVKDNSGVWSNYVYDNITF